ncbi:MAG TPA: head decoration protein [Nitrobacter sp.]|nr:head decoration protein [Nitrobacter sp.]
MALTTLSYKTDADVVKTEGPNRISRDEGILARGTAANVSIPGLVVGKIAIGGAIPAAKSGGNTGNGVLTMDGTTPVLTGAKAGVYQVRLITAAANGGTFRVFDPEGFDLGDVAVGATFSNDIKFSVADGATDFIVGDGFDITVAIGSGKYAPFNLTGNNGSEKPVAILLETVDASAADKRVVLLARHAEVVLQSLVWPAGINATQKAAALAALETKGIVARMGV